MKNGFKAGIAGALTLAAGLAAAPAANAAIVCNREGVCWHVARPYAYPRAYGIVVHPNRWTWGPGGHYVWREHEGRGYWRNGVWVTF